MDTPNEFELARKEAAELAEQGVSSVMSADLRAIQDRKIQLMKLFDNVLKVNIDYGVIARGMKPSLWQPGAQSICSAFGLAPEYEEEIIDLPGDHREYRIKCKLSHNGRFMGEGIAVCTTRESKYRWRKAEPELTDKAVPREYWEAKNNGDWKQAQTILGGKGFTTKKDDSGNWRIAKATGKKIENPDIADEYNTCYKMGAKRALVAAVLTVTGASRLWTQDVEDMEDLIRARQHIESTEINGDDSEKARKDVAANTAKQNAGEANLKRADQTVKAFEQFGVTQENLEQIVNCRKERWNAEDFDRLREMFSSFRDGSADPVRVKEQFCKPAGGKKKKATTKKTPKKEKDPKASDTVLDSDNPRPIVHTKPDEDVDMFAPPKNADVTEVDTAASEEIPY